MEFSEYAALVRRAATQLGIRLPMMKMNEAIARACFNRPYSSVVAADRQGKVQPIPDSPPFLAAVANSYRIDADIFAKAFEDVDSFGNV